MSSAMSLNSISIWSNEGQVWLEGEIRKTALEEKDVEKVKRLFEKLKDKQAFSYFLLKDIEALPFAVRDNGQIYSIIGYLREVQAKELESNREPFWFPSG